MRLPSVVAAALLIAAPALAQPSQPSPAPIAPTAPAKAPAPAPAKAPAAAPAKPAAPAARRPATGDADYDREMAAIFASGGLTADQAAQRSRTASVEVKRKIAEAAEAATRTRSANLTWVPQVKGTARYTRLSDVENTLEIPGGGSFSLPVVLNSYSLSAEVGIPLSDYLLRFPHLIKSAKAGERAAALSRRATELDVATQARSIYYQWVGARLQLVVAERTVAQVGRTLEQIRALADVQRASRADLLRVEAQQAQAELGLAQAKERVALAEEQLRVAIGAGAEEELTVGEDVRADLEVPAFDSASAMAAAAMSRRFDAKAIDVAVEATGIQKRALLADKLPKLTAFGSYNYDNPNQRIFSSEDEFNGTWAVGAQVQWSLNDFLAASPKEDASDAEARQLLADRERLSLGVRVQVLSALQNVELAKQSLSTTAQGLAASEEGYRVRKELLAAERATIVELIDAETELTRARIAAIDARVNLRIALASLRHAAGLDAE